ncbi:glycosyltransferase family 21 protein [Athelia psychrophila]|uniref:Ceramide glucosyltransferase n=1 Tax=Athelia psychrophila TaxID=1759441 RepID=A0A166U0D0_9AGAM|nr:glycosyltransferase family 21 protein [Fibularhizoctonia sp. CBS 109695]
MAITEPSSAQSYNAQTILAVIVLTWYIVLWALGLSGCITARKRYRVRPRSPLATSSTAPGVSILRPLKGLDTNLYENLESTFQQEYPNFEIIFSVADENDQALCVVRELMRQYPDVDAKISTGEEVVGVNPKVNNLMRPYHEAANDILWVIDSGVTVSPGTLARSVDALNRPSENYMLGAGKRIGVVHHVPFAHVSGAGYIGSQIEEAFLNTNHAKMYIALNSTAIDSCVVGKSNLFRRSDVERVDGSLKPHDGLRSHPEPTKGLAAFGKYLAEDNMLASALWHELDIRHDLSCDVAHNFVGHMTLADYVWRRVRWIRVRKHMILAATLLEPFTESVVVGVLAAISLRYLTGFPAWIMLVAHFGSFLWVDLDVYESLAGYPLPAASRWQFIGGWIARELLAFPIYMLAIFGNEVSWRGTTYQVLQNGEARATSGSIPDCYEPINANPT